MRKLKMNYRASFKVWFLNKDGSISLDDSQYTLDLPSVHNDYLNVTVLSKLNERCYKGKVTNWELIEFKQI